MGLVGVPRGAPEGVGPPAASASTLCGHDRPYWWIEAVSRPLSELLCLDGPFLKAASSVVHTFSLRGLGCCREANGPRVAPFVCSDPRVNQGHPQVPPTLLARKDQRAMFHRDPARMKG